jgi:large subunit ribosomal protein L10
MLTRTEKEKKVEELAELLSSAKGIYIADFTGLDVAAMTELRRTCRESGIRFEVIKNSLARFAAQKAQVEGLPDHFTGPSAIATSETDEIVPARVLTDFAKEREGPKIRVAYVEGEIYDEKAVKSLAALPPRDVLIGNLVRVLMAPLTQFATILRAPVRDLAGLLGQVAEKSGEKGGGEEPPKEGS